MAENSDTQILLGRWRGTEARDALIRRLYPELATIAAAGFAASGAIRSRCDAAPDAQMILGMIARDAGNRDLACESWIAAANTWAELEGRDQVAGYVKAFMPGLQDKKTLCAKGTPLSGLKAPPR